MNQARPYVARRSLLGSSAGVATLAALGAGSTARAVAAESEAVNSHTGATEEPMATGGTNDLPVTHHTAEINGIRMHYVTAGTGEPVVLVHGFPQTWYAWRKIIPALAARHMVIAPDLRGCGDTDRPDAAFEKRTAAEDIHQLVQHLGVGSVNLVGHDVGTMVSYAYAAAYRSEIRRLALMESALPGFGLEELYDGDAYHFETGEESQSFVQCDSGTRARLLQFGDVLQAHPDATQALRERGPAFGVAADSPLAQVLAAQPPSGDRQPDERRGRDHARSSEAAGRGAA